MTDRKPKKPVKTVQYDRSTVMAEICRDIANGDSVNKALRKPGRPDASTFYRWIQENKNGERKALESAREALAHYYASEVVEIADTETNTALAKNRIDARKWYSRVSAPRYYGETTHHAITGPDGDSIFTGLARVIVDARDGKMIDGGALTIADDSRDTGVSKRSK